MLPLAALARLLGSARPSGPRMRTPVGGYSSRRAMEGCTQDPSRYRGMAFRTGSLPIMRIL